ncbi:MULTISPECIES: DinB family protein [Streptomyces]|uniref:DinB family protein n=1 Tax=Streptomyces yangpuensis TaxID=1648182 RepID=A0ABY5PYN3_9ACTN|nr:MULTISPECIES: DinB family protein [Streptomyces]MBZ9597221.1 DinB family protein [Streptomyces erythrochromogenes]UUY49045.1 DinB family protein [Streptomyces yangpuensis]
MAQLPTDVPGDERGTLLAFVESQRAAIRASLAGLDEEQAASRPSASELSLSGLLKHVAEVELNWLRLAQQQPNERMRDEASYADSFRLVEGESIPSVLAFWDGVRQETEAYVTAVASLDAAFPLPPAPWFPKDTKVSLRWMLLHLVEEFARHAGHADVIRESIDGTKAMG